MSGTWTTARYIKPGDYLGDVVDGLLKPTVKVTHVGRDGTVIRLTVQNAPPMSLYGFVVQGEAEFYVFDAPTPEQHIANLTAELRDEIAAIDATLAYADECQTTTTQED